MTVSDIYSLQIIHGHFMELKLNNKIYATKGKLALISFD